MTVRQFGVRLGMSHSTVVALDQGEVAGTLTLAGLQKAAEALDCTLHYVLVPNRPLAAMVRDQARAVAEARLAPVDHNMRLESQGLSEAGLAVELDRLTEDYARRGAAAGGFGARLERHRPARPAEPIRPVLGLALCRGRLGLQSRLALLGGQHRA